MFAIDTGEPSSAGCPLPVNPSPTRAELAHGISGNLCRCADYHKILNTMMVAGGTTRRS